MTQPTNGSTPAEEPTAAWACTDSAGVPHATMRARRYVEGLPDWEPLPPGEINVSRRRD